MILRVYPFWGSKQQYYLVLVWCPYHVSMRGVGIRARRQSLIRSGFERSWEIEKMV